MPNQLPQQQFTPEQGQQARQEILKLVQEANLPAEVLVEIGQWAEKVIAQPKLFPEFQTWLKSKGLDDSDIPTEPDYQELASMIMIGNVAQDLVTEAPEPAEGPVAPISPEQMAGMAQQGRNGDTQLAHINAEEAQMLKAMGGTGTINPATGLPEYGIFSDIFKGLKKVVKAVAPFVLPAVAIFYPPALAMIGTTLGASAALAPIVGASVLAGGATALSGGSIKQVLTSAALTGLGSYLTPVVGKYVGGITGIESPTLQSVLGSAIFSGGVAAARGSTVSQILTAAATGGVSNYIGQVAGNAINSAKITNKYIDQGVFEDAVFAAADAKGLADQGLSKTAIQSVLQTTGLSSDVAATAANLAVTGAEADSIAVSLSNQYGGYQLKGTKTLYTNGGDGAQNSVVGGGNVKALEQVQKIEDALLITQDAKNIADTLAQQGITGRAAQPAIEQNLMAAGVDARAAAYIADGIVSNYSVNGVANGVVDYHKTATLFGEPKDFTTSKGDVVSAREVGGDLTKVTTRAEIQNQKFNEALTNATTDYTTGSTASDIDFAVADAKQLYAQGLRGSQITDVLKASGMSAQQANYLGSNAGLAENTLKYDLSRSIGNYGKIPVYQAPPPPPPVVSKDQVNAAYESVAPPTPPVVDPNTNTTTQVFDDGSVLVTDTTTGQVVSATDTTGQVVVAPPPTAPAQPATPTAPATPTTNTDSAGAQVRADNLVRQNPNFTPEQVRDFLVRNYNFDPEVALTAARTSLGVSTTPVAPTPPPPTTTQVFDDGSQLVTDTQTGQVVSTTPGTDVILPTATIPEGVTEVSTQRQWAPRGDGQGTTTTYSDGSSRFVGDDGSVYTKQPDRGWTQISNATPTPTPTPDRKSVV
jgi:hypothetical protein